MSKTQNCLYSTVTYLRKRKKNQHYLRQKHKNYAFIHTVIQI